MPHRSAPDSPTVATPEGSGLTDLASPTDWFGFRLGSDRQLARWPELVRYYQHLAERSDRFRFTELGLSTGGLPLVLVTVSSPTNLARTERLQWIQQRLADQRVPLSADERADLIGEARTVCLITCSIHGTEVGASQMAPELAHRLAISNDPDTLEMLENVVLLLVPSLNPEGLELAAEWYAETLGTPYEGSPPPQLYHRYAGHDNNRDWFMQVLAETGLVIERVHNPWRPQIVFDLHQMQPTGPRYFLPPYVDPYDPNVDPLLQAQISELGTAMAADLIAAGKSGIATSVIFDAYSPSRAYQHYHGGVRILSEAAGAKLATPVYLTTEQLIGSRGFDPRLSTQNHPVPWSGGRWSLADIVEHNLIAAMSLLRHAAQNRDRWVQNFARIQARSLTIGRPAAFILPGYECQRDPGALYDLLEVLHRGDVEVERTAEPFTFDGAEYPTGTFIVRVAQPFGRFAKTLLEVQHYPEVPEYPGGPPRPPYDNTGHTLPLLLGVECIQADNVCDVRAERTVEIPRPPGGIVGSPKRASAYIISAETNASVKLIAKLVDIGSRVSRLREEQVLDEEILPAGTYVIEQTDADQLDRWAREFGVFVRPAPGEARWPLGQVHMPRIGLYSSWRPNAIDTGWTRYVLDEYGFPYREVRDAEIRRGKLEDSYDVLIFAQEQLKQILEGNSIKEYPARYAGGIGEIGMLNVRHFVEHGGTLITLDSACDLAINALGLPVANVLEGRPAEQFSSPGSLLQVCLDVHHPVAWGLPERVAAMFVSSPAFIVRDAPRRPVTIVGRYPDGNPLLSGWIRGPEYLKGTAAVLEASVGRGRAVLIGFRPQYRAQARGTYRLLFNSILSAGRRR